MTNYVRQRPAAPQSIGFMGSDPKAPPRPLALVQLTHLGCKTDAALRVIRMGRAVPLPQPR